LCCIGTQLPLPKGAQYPNFRLTSTVAKRSHISATAEHLFETGDDGLIIFRLDVRKFVFSNRQY